MSFAHALELILRFSILLDSVIVLGGVLALVRIFGPCAFDKLVSVLAVDGIALTP